MKLFFSIKINEKLLLRSLVLLTLFFGFVCFNEESYRS